MKEQDPRTKWRNRNQERPGIPWATRDEAMRERPSHSAVVLMPFLYEFMGFLPVSCPMCIFILPSISQLSGFSPSQDVLQR